MYSNIKICQIFYEVTEKGNCSIKLINPHIIYRVCLCFCHLWLYDTFSCILSFERLGIQTWITKICSDLDLYAKSQKLRLWLWCGGLDSKLQLVRCSLIFVRSLSLILPCWNVNSCHALIADRKLPQKVNLFFWEIYNLITCWNVNKYYFSFFFFYS